MCHTAEQLAMSSLSNQPINSFAGESVDWWWGEISKYKDLKMTADIFKSWEWCWFSVEWSEYVLGRNVCALAGFAYCMAVSIFTSILACRLVLVEACVLRVVLGVRVCTAASNCSIFQSSVVVLEACRDPIRANICGN